MNMLLVLVLVLLEVENRSGGILPQLRAGVESGDWRRLGSRHGNEEAANFASIQFSNYVWRVGSGESLLAPV
jgi:hypothetical protein